MQISYDLFQAQHRPKVHTHYLVFQVAFPFILLRQWFPQVGSEMRSRSMAVCFATRFVLWECVTSFPDISALLGSELQRLRQTSGLLLAQDWFLAGALSSGSVLWLGSNRSPLFFLRLLLKSHQVCRNLKNRSITNWLFKSCFFKILFNFLRHFKSVQVLKTFWPKYHE